jgi:hypothetical protein|tara:strand:+ start:1904 stop:2152 length:249 start_codon:yes stop_codon:yes gene_type:complete
MKEFILTLVMCSSVENVCMPAHTWPVTFKDSYSCMLEGYQESYRKIKQIGREEINEHGIYIKFDCTPYEITLPEKKPVGKYV